ncbi:MAG: hypothetical protein COT88_00520 [Candidatus Colwellbacteria bacterium CG10_big_fil_rev_8_21_14_0_10_41_28]|uniref:POTRA domain-containing protein n=1 Tax=Candidatus Colwellbacteria bacterium CG10_big_fil_rev_8_21_14_0_10_41_28 TaxID=1974539 RepID=A0A2H0VHR4_9BACT|nr:MAG: hypothetical protein COT88_00520 [Candidatus Colwellbacteria bacterium CG10_big_fil_rev_8_21_14_0_10_41_28]
MLVKKRSKAYRLLTKIAFLSSLVLLIGGLIYLFFFSDIFKIKSIEVEGRELAPDVDLGEVGENILFWKLNQDNLPSLVESVEVDKKYWDGSVLVTFNEREKYLIWCYEIDRSCYWVDRDGLLFSGAPDLRGPLVFKIVRDQKASPVQIGEQVIPNKMYVNLVAAFDFLDRYNISVNEFVIEDIARREAVARVAGDKDIYFSLTENPDFGGSVVNSLKKSGEWNLIRYLDLRVPDRAYYSL